MKRSDQPQFHVAWYSTGRGVSNEDGAKNRVYYGKVFRIPRDAVNDEEQRLTIENRACSTATVFGMPGILNIGNFRSRRSLSRIWSLILRLAVFGSCWNKSGESVPVNGRR